MLLSNGLQSVYVLLALLSMNNHNSVGRNIVKLKLGKRLWKQRCQIRVKRVMLCLCPDCHVGRTTEFFKKIGVMDS